MQKMLAKFQKAKILADVDKCKFHITETKYLGLISIKMNPAKVDTIK